MDKEQKKQNTERFLEAKNSHIEFEFIKDKPPLVYLIKKIEKLSGVIHILTNNLSDNEPIKNLLRQESLGLLKGAVERGKSVPGIVSLESNILNCLSLIGVAEQSLVISGMNSQVLRAEFQKLIPIIALLYRDERERFAFDPKSLDVSPGLISVPLAPEISKGHKGQTKERILSNTPKQKPEKEKKDQYNSIGHSDSTRSKIILDVVRNKGEVGIKDITAIVRGVSSKTIQRDLSALVLNGVLKKSGERRWSRYSIK